jgi:LmbE family N-acetylglucosaminyl deacetylase
MFNLTDLGSSRALNLLCIGAHSDDIEIGCAGTLIRLLQEHPGSHVTWVVLSAEGARAQEARTSAEDLLSAAGSTDARFGQFRDGHFPWEGSEIKDFMEDFARGLQPDLVFTHHLADRHQDHRTTGEITWNTFRDHLILEYEILKYDADLASPNLFVPLTERIARRKVRHLLDHFPSQRSRHWFAADSFEALLRLRGIESRSPAGVAEAFHSRKLVLNTRS